MVMATEMLLSTLSIELISIQTFISIKRYCELIIPQSLNEDLKQHFKAPPTELGDLKSHPITLGQLKPLQIIIVMLLVSKYTGAPALGLCYLNRSLK